MEYLILSDTEERIIKFGLSFPERYINGINEDESDPWWNVHIYVKKPMIVIDNSLESMTKGELIELVELIDKSRTARPSQKIVTWFMEQDYTFEMDEYSGLLSINLKYADSLVIWLDRNDLDRIAEYIKDTLGLQ